VVRVIGMAVVVAVCLADSGGAGEVRLTRGPTAAVVADGVRITFTVSRPTDVAVAVLDAHGTVVRHLAAGVLGRRPPAPLQPGLSQSLVWDGKDDLGKPPVGGPFKVRVRLGLKPQFDRILGWRGEALGHVAGLTVAADGRLYVLSTGFKRPTSVHVLTRSGKYLKTIMPYPANLPEERVKGLGLIRLADGRRVPIVRTPINFSFYPDAYGTVPAGGLPAQTMALVGDQLVFSNAWRCNYATNVTRRRLLIINTDGGVPENYLGPLLASARCPGYVHVAPAPGGTHVFCAGLIDGDHKTGRPRQVVYRVALSAKGPAEPYLGELGTAGSDEMHFNDPRGVAVDRHGNLYVADNGNDRIVVFNRDGEYLGQVAVEAPGQVALHQRTCAIYVLSGRVRFPAQAKRLLKLSPAVDPAGKWLGHSTVQAGMKWQYGLLVFAVDGTADPRSGESRPTVVWLGGWLSRQSRFLLRMEEARGSFTRPAPILPADDPALVYGGPLTVDREREEVYVRNLLVPGWARKHCHTWVRLNGRTGEAARTPIAAHEMAVGPEGALYAIKALDGYNAVLARFDRAGKPLPFPETGTHVLRQGNFLKGTFYPIQHCTRGLSVAPNGDVYVLNPSHELKKPQKYVHCAVDIYGPDGRLKRKNAVWASNAASSVRADAAGNMYIAENVKPRDCVIPPELSGQVPTTTRWKHGFNWYPWMYGSVVKFPPAGGAVRIRGTWGGSHWGSRWKPLPAWRPPGDAPVPQPIECVTRHNEPASVQNAVWLHPGLSPAPAHAGGCVCFGPRFDVDGFGRVFLPDVARCSVEVIDAAGHSIARFVPFAWPQYVGVSDEAVYVSDVMNRRIVRVRLGCAVEAACPVE